MYKIRKTESQIIRRLARKIDKQMDINKPTLASGSYSDQSRINSSKWWGPENNVNQNKFITKVVGVYVCLIVLFSRYR